MNPLKIFTLTSSVSSNSRIDKLSILEAKSVFFSFLTDFKIVPNTDTVDNMLNPEMKEFFTYWSNVAYKDIFKISLTPKDPVQDYIRVGTLDGGPIYQKLSSSIICIIDGNKFIDYKSIYHFLLEKYFEDKFQGEDSEKLLNEEINSKKSESIYETIYPFVGNLKLSDARKIFELNLSHMTVEFATKKPLILQSFKPIVREFFSKYESVIIGRHAFDVDQKHLADWFMDENVKCTYISSEYIVRQDSDYIYYDEEETHEVIPPNDPNQSIYHFLLAEFFIDAYKNKKYFELWKSLYDESVKPSTSNVFYRPVQ